MSTADLPQYPERRMVRGNGIHGDGGPYERLRIVEDSLSITGTIDGQVLASRVRNAGDRIVAIDVTLDYWSDPRTGEQSNVANVALEYHVQPWATLEYDAASNGCESSETVQSSQSAVLAQLNAIRDYRNPINITLVVNKDDELVRIPVIVRVAVLDTPVRISGNRGAEQRGVGATTSTGEIGWRYFADPQIVAYGSKYYIFPTTDGYADWGGWQIHCFASDDLVTWEDRGVVVDLKDQHLDGSGRTDILPDRTSCAWAPGFAIRDGKFYLYFSGHGRADRTNQTNVAISDRIDGGYELQSLAGFNHDGVVAGDIDPAVFEDPRTGKWWITWGQSPGMYAELADDMMSIVPGTIVETDATRGIREGSYLHARCYKGVWTYYYTYSIDDTSSEWYRIAYATAPSMEGDGSQWTYRGEMLVQDASKGIRGTGHHSILQVPGTDDWYIAYHCFLDDTMRPRGVDTRVGKQLMNGNKREVRIAKFTYTHPDDAAIAAGEVPLINAVPVTLAGVRAQRYEA